MNNIENLLYAYLVISASMIVFNIVCIFTFKQRDESLIRHSRRFEEKIHQQLTAHTLTDQHQKYLLKKLSRVRYLMAYDRTLEELQKTDREQVAAYLKKLRPVFVELARKYAQKNKLHAAYFLYIVQKYALFRGLKSKEVSKIFLGFVQDDNLYCRENALQAIYSTGSCEDVVRAILLLNNSGLYHNQKLLTDGLLKFKGDHKRLAKKLWGIFDRLNPVIAVAILNYFRYHSAGHKKQMLALLKDHNRNREIIFACLRYFGKYRYVPAYPLIMEYAKNPDDAQWEAEAIACSALASYPSPDTTKLLKEKLHSRHWYTRYNASQSLNRLGLEYGDLIDIIEGPDIFASDMLIYRLEQKKFLKKKEITAS